MYTDTIWGINIMKEVIVSLLSGATIPLAFFPDSLRRVVELLPFQTICNTPIKLLLHNEYGITQYAQMFGIQIFWLLALRLLSEWFFNVSVKRITVNGG